MTDGEDDRVDVCATRNCSEIVLKRKDRFLFGVSPELRVDIVAQRLTHDKTESLIDRVT